MSNRDASAAPIPEHVDHAYDDEPYVVTDERLDEIKALIDWKHAGWQTIPKPGVTVYDLAAAIEDLLIEREEADRGS